MDQPCSRGINNHYEDKRQHESSAEVWFDTDKRRQPTCDETTGNKRAPEVAFLSGALLEKVSKEDSEGQLGNLGGLQGEVPLILDPPMAAIDFPKPKYRY